MSRRGRDNATQAAQAASEAARVLQQRGQEARAEQQKAAEQEPERANRPEAGPAVRTVVTRNEPRRRSMEEIEARDMRSKGIEDAPPEVKEEVASDPTPPTPEEMLHGSKVTAEVAAEAPAAEPVKPAVEPVPEAPKTIKAKVDGEEVEAPVDEVEAAGGLKAWQRDKASENRLKKANEALAETRRLQAEMLERARQAAMPPPKPEPSIDQLIESKADEIRFGSPEQFRAAMQEILSKAVRPIDENAVIAKAAQQIEHNQAVQMFDREFADVSSNPLLLKLVVALRNERIPQEKGPIDWQNFYRKIGNEVRSVAGRQSQPATAQAAPATSSTPSSPSEKEARKASIVNLPTAAARAELPKDSKPETREDVLNEMRRKRGIPTG